MCAHVVRLVGCFRSVTFNIYGIHHPIGGIDLHNDSVFLAVLYRLAVKR